MNNRPFQPGTRDLISLSGSTALAEAHFSTGRFAECGKTHQRPFSYA
jgi:hypothetical protein